MSSESPDLSAAYAEVQSVVRTSESVRHGMTRLVGYCERIYPGESWSSILCLDFESDLQNLQQWLEDLLSTEPPDASIAAFWAGLFHPTMPDSSESCGLYIAGADQFDESDDTGDWASSPAYFPAGAYADSKVLHEIFRIVSAMGNGGGAAILGEYVLCLGYAGLAFVRLSQTLSKKLLLGNRESRALAVGFDSGDFLLVDPIR